MKKTVVLVLCCVFLISGVVFGAIDVGDKAEPVRVRKWLTKNPPSLDVLAGKVHLIQFWATWCPYCVDSIPKMNEVHSKYSADGLVVAALSVDKNQYAVGDLMKKKDFDYPVAYDGGAEKIYGIKSFPRDILIDAYGNVVWINNWFDQTFTDAVEKALKEAPVPVFKDIDLSEFDDINVPLVEGAAFAKIYKILTKHAEADDNEKKVKAQEILTIFDERVEGQFAFAEKLQSQDKQMAMAMFMNIAKSYRGPKTARKAMIKVKELKVEIAKAKT